jgi:hypothetical protein
VIQEAVQITVFQQSTFTPPFQRLLIRMESRIFSKEEFFRVVIDQQHPVATRVGVSAMPGDSVARGSLRDFGDRGGLQYCWGRVGCCSAVGDFYVDEKGG